MSLRVIETPKEIRKQEIVDQLEALLERVKAGEVHTVAMTYIFVGGNYDTWSYGPDNISSIGVVTALQHRLLADENA